MKWMVASMTKRYVVIRLHEVHRLSVSRWAVWGEEVVGERKDESC